MRRLLQVIGVLLIVMGVRSLLNLDWVFFVINTALGASFLIGTKVSKGVQRLRGVLLVVVFVLAIARLANIL